MLIIFHLKQALELSKSIKSNPIMMQWHVMGAFTGRSHRLGLRSLSSPSALAAFMSHPPSRARPFLTATPPFTPARWLFISENRRATSSLVSESRCAPAILQAVEQIQGLRLHGGAHGNNEVRTPAKRVVILSIIPFPVLSKSRRHHRHLISTQSMPPCFPNMEVSATHRDEGSRDARAGKRIPHPCNLQQAYSEIADWPCLRAKECMNSDLHI